MKKDAGILFGVFFGAFVLFSVLFSLYINDITGLISDPSNIFEVIGNFGVFGWLWSTLSFVCFIISIILLFKSFRD